jgi:hypothetical protein
MAQAAKKSRPVATFKHPVTVEVYRPEFEVFHPSGILMRPSSRAPPAQKLRWVPSRTVAVLKWSAR